MAESPLLQHHDDIENGITSLWCTPGQTSAIKCNLAAMLIPVCSVLLDVGLQGCNGYAMALFARLMDVFQSPSVRTVAQ